MPDAFANLTHAAGEPPTASTSVDLTADGAPGTGERESRPSSDAATAGSPPVVPGGLTACTCVCGCTAPARLTAGISPARAAVEARYVRCADCRVPGHVPVLVDPAEDAALARAAADEAAAAAHALAVSQWAERVPARFAAADVDGNPFLADRVARFLAGTTSGFVCSGAYGTGKTWKAFGFLNHLVRTGAIHPSKILFGGENELLGIISMGGFEEREAARRRILDPKYQIVFIDDVGQGTFRSVKDMHSIWHEIIDRIWSTDRVIIVSTNLSPAPPAAASTAAAKADATGKAGSSPLEQWMGEAAFDRLGASIGYAVAVDGTDESHRRVISAQIEAAWAARAGHRTDA